MDTSIEQLKINIENAWNDRGLLKLPEYKKTVEFVISELDKGHIRVAELKNNEWHLNEWVKKAVLLFFPISEMKVTKAGPLEFYDKVPLKTDYDKIDVRVVPNAVSRFGSYVAPGAILMPSFVNIGAYVDSGTMVDSWVTVGSCAQIGKNVHLSSGVVIGGVLEPLQASPVIVEDNCFIGSQCIVVEGAIISEEAVLAAGTVITGSTKIIDATSENKIEYKGCVPPRSVVVPGSYSKIFPGGTFNVNCAIIIGKRKESTDKKTSLNSALRDFALSV